MNIKGHFETITRHKLLVMNAGCMSRVLPTT